MGGENRKRADKPGSGSAQSPGSGQVRREPGVFEGILDSSGGSPPTGNPAADLRDIEEPVDLSTSGSSSYEMVSDEDLHSIGSAPVPVTDLDPPDDEAKTAYSERPPDPPASPPGVMRDPSPTTGARPRNKSVPPPKDRRIGAVLSGRSRLEKLIGKGGMGRVYLATQFPLNRAVAVKILNPEFQRKDPQFVRRFFLEAATAARLSHQNTITVFDYGETERKELYIAMEYLKGRPLSRALSTDGPFGAERALHVGKQVVRALR